jgi:hypothetical protein
VVRFAAMGGEQDSRREYRVESGEGIVGRDLRS